MINLKTTYMGIDLETPIIVGASNLTANLDNLKKAEEYGAAAIVYKSLFEEQVQLEKLQMDQELTEFNDLHAEMITTHPDIKHAGPEEHLFNLRKAREHLFIPLIASLNAVNDETWIKYAKLISETGVNGIELNFYQNPADAEKSAKEIEEEQIRIVSEIKKNITIPVCVKLSSDYTNILHFVNELDKIGVNAIVIFNSFFQPDIDINTEKHIKSFNLSKEGDYKKSLRYAGLLYGNIKADICSSRGIYNGEDVIKLLLSGATCVQVVSTLYKNGLYQLKTIQNELVEWMEQKNYTTIDDFRGKLSKNKLSSNPFIYKRAQYADLLINSEQVLGGGSKI